MGNTPPASSFLNAFRIAVPLLAMATFTNDRVAAQDGSSRAIPTWDDVLDADAVETFSGSDYEAAWLSNDRLLLELPEPQGAGGNPFRAKQITLVNVDDGERRLLVTGSNAEPAADGSHIAYISESGALAVLAVSDPETPHIIVEGWQGETTSFFEGEAYAWAPDGRRLAYILKRDAQTPDGPLGSDLFIYDRATGETSLALRSDDLAATQVAWRVDGGGLFIRRSRISAPFEFYRGAPAYGEIGAFDLSTKSYRKLTDRVFFTTLGDLSPSPDGKWVAFLSPALSNSYIPIYTSVTALSLESGETRLLHGDVGFPAYLGEIDWLPDSRAVTFALATRNVFSDIVRADLEGGAPERVPTDPSRGASSPALSPNGRYLAFQSRDARGSIELRLFDRSRRQERTLVRWSPNLSRYQLGEAEQFTYRAADGLPISGVLIKPHGFDRSRRYPLIVDVHGGPYGGTPYPALVSSPLQWHRWTALGYVVFVADYRDSMLYGFSHTIEGHRAGRGPQLILGDVESGVDDLARRGFVDTERMFMLGHSYGGMIATWAACSSNRYRGIIVSEPVGLETLAGQQALEQQPSVRQTVEAQYGASATANPQFWEPLLIAESDCQQSTPLLFISGQLSAASTVQAFINSKFRESERDVTHLVLQGEGHLPMGRANRELMFETAETWLRDHGGGKR